MTATMKADPTPQCGTYNQNDANGFIRLNALGLKSVTEAIGKGNS